MRKLEGNELKQRTLENYQACTKWLKENGREDFMQGNMNAYRETLQNAGYTWKELEDQAFVDKEIQTLREETTLTKKQEILNKFWHDFSNDMYCFNTEEYEGLARYFKGYSNGLLQARIIEVQEHIEITNKVTDKLNEEKAIKEKRFI